MWKRVHISTEASSLEGLTELEIALLGPQEELVEILLPGTVLHGRTDDPPERRRDVRWDFPTQFLT